MSTPAARELLIQTHAEIARRIALSMSRHCPAWIGREDLVSAGMVGLIEAADRYDDSRREPFLSFAEHRIRGAVLDELRRGDIMPRRLRQLARKIAAAMRELERSGEAITEQRLAEALGVTLEVYRSDLAELAHVEVRQLEQTAQLADDRALPDALADRRVKLGRVRDALDELAPRDAAILNMHYVEELTYQQIADTLHITPSRVCQLLWRAIERLRGFLGAPSQLEAA